MLHHHLLSSQISPLFTAVNNLNEVGGGGVLVRMPRNTRCCRAAERDAALRPRPLYHYIFSSSWSFFSLCLFFCYFFFLSFTSDMFVKTYEAHFCNIAALAK